MQAMIGHSKVVPCYNRVLSWSLSLLSVNATDSTKYQCLIYICAEHLDQITLIKQICIRKKKRIKQICNLFSSVNSV